MKSIFKTTCLTIFISLSCSLNLIAQKNNIKFCRITPEEGLSQNGVNCILQDSQTFICFGTGGELNKYDGYNFAVYRYCPDKPNNLSSNDVRANYFRVKDSNNDGVWNAEGVSIKIITLSPFRQTLWFRILTAIFLLGLIFIVYRKRAEYIEAQKKTLEIQVAERTTEIANKNRQLKSALRELKKVQSQLVQAQKMATLSNLAAGIVHEINNPVGAINSAADTSSRSLSKIIITLEESRDLKEIKEDKNFMKALNILKSNNSITKMASERITKIIQSLKNFTRLEEAEFQEADVHEGLESTLILLHHEIKNRIKVVKELGDISKIYCYPIQLNQVFMNVLANAVQAIEDKGTITIRTSKSDDKIIISISDNGIGIKKENLKNIFNPGFTTKGAGGGAGLGLSISYNIIKTHKGEIKVNSEEGKGTEVIITLPIKQEGVPT